MYHFDGVEKPLEVLDDLFYLSLVQRVEELVQLFQVLDIVLDLVSLLLNLTLDFLELVQKLSLLFVESFVGL